MAVVRCLVVSVVFFVALAVSAHAEELTYYSDPLPPFNFVENGRVQGIAVDILREISAMAGTPFDASDVNMIPWVRAYKLAQTQNGAVLFSMARTEQREKLFKWVGPIHSITIGLIGKREMMLSSLDKLAKYRVGTVKDSAPEQMLVRQGIPAIDLRRLASPVLNIRKLAEGRIDLFAHVDMPSAYIMESEGIDPQRFRVVYPLKTLELYIAFNRKTDNAYIARLNEALEELKQPVGDGPSRYTQIIQAYIKSGGLSLAPSPNVATAWR